MRRPTVRSLRYRARHQPRGWLLRRRVDRCGRRLFADRGAAIRKAGPACRVELGDHVLLARDTLLVLDGPRAVVTIGDRTYLSRRTEVVALERVRIGADCAIAWDVCIMDSSGHLLDGGGDTAPVEIGDHVWIGARATVLAGVTIGEGAVVAAGAVVTRDVPRRALVAGVPARVLREDVDWETVPVEELLARTLPAQTDP
jgi:acetyltransferase-like isoleucine patch superfamily enzyme